MKVLMINGSCHENGSTFALLREIADELHKNAVETRAAASTRKVAFIFLRS